MSNVSNFLHKREMESLISKVGSVENCERLGFVYNEGGMWHLADAGFAYLLHLAEIDDEGSLELARAFAKRYQEDHS